MAPVLLPGADRPATMHSGTLAGIERIRDVSPFRGSSANHPEGTLVVTPETSGEAPTIVEIDIATLRVVRERTLPHRASGVELAATPSGVIATLDESTPNGRGDNLTFVLDAELRITKTLRSTHPGESNVHADGALGARVLSRIGRAELVTLELPSGREIARRELVGSVITESLLRPQLVVRGDRVYSLAHVGRQLVIRALPFDLRTIVAEIRVPAEYLPSIPPMRVFGDGQLVPAPGGVLLVRPSSTGHYDLDLRSVGLRDAKIADFPNPPAIDPQTGRVLFPSGAAATSIADSRTEPVVAFRRDHFDWAPSGKYERRHNDPVAAFFVESRGVIVTHHPTVRVTVLEWRSPPPKPPGSRMY